MLLKTFLMGHFHSTELGGVDAAMASMLSGLLTPMDSYFWGFVKQKVYTEPISSIRHLTLNKRSKRIYVVYGRKLSTDYIYIYAQPTMENTINFAKPIKFFF